MFDCAAHIELPTSNAQPPTQSIPTRSLLCLASVPVGDDNPIIIRQPAVEDAVPGSRLICDREMTRIGGIHLCKPAISIPIDARIIPTLDNFTRSGPYAGRGKDIITHTIGSGPPD